MGSPAGGSPNGKKTSRSASFLERFYALQLRLISFVYETVFMNLIYRFLSVHLFGRPFPKPWCSSDGVVFINILSFLVLVSILLVALIKGIVLPVYLVVLATLFALVISYPAALFSAREWPTKANFLGHYSFLTVLKIVGAVIFILLVISHRSDLFVL
jgi:hypothetical protein